MQVPHKWKSIHKGENELDCIKIIPYGRQFLLENFWRNSVVAVVACFGDRFCIDDCWLPVRTTVISNKLGGV